MPLLDRTDPAPEQTEALENGGRLRFGLRSALVVGTAVAVWITTRWWLRTSDAADRAASHIVLPLCVVGLVVFAMIAHVRWWHDPRRKFLGLLKGIRAGHFPIESLKEVRGGMKKIAGDVGELLHQFRALERKLAEKDFEADQRVANKEDALQRVIGSLRLQAIRDPLTGLFNRRALDELLPRLIDHSLQKSEDLSLLMIDVDFFKQLNDQLGHAAGDEMLRSIGQLVRSSLGRPQDVGFRCGGDEFIIVLPGAPIEIAQKLADRLTSLVGNMAKTIRCNPRPGLSIGLASLRQIAGPNAVMLLQEADKRLYEIKQRRHKQVQSPAA